MKKIILSIILLTAIIAVDAQNTKPGTKPPVKPATKPVTKPATKPAVNQGTVLKTEADSVSYVLGEIAGYNLIQQGLGDVKMNNAAFLQAVTDILGKKKPLLEDAIANGMLSKYMEKKQTEKIKPTIEEGRKFLAQNKLKPGVITTTSGLQYEILKQGTGIKPTLLDTFVAHYRGTLLDGTVFDESYNKGQPLTWQVNQVISGWTEALQMMPIGSKYKLYIPYEIAYGAAGSGKIPGGAMLTFEIELLDVKKKQ